MLPPSQLREKISGRSVDGVRDPSAATPTTVHRVTGFIEPTAKQPARSNTTRATIQLLDHNSVEFGCVVQWQCHNDTLRLSPKLRLQPACQATEPCFNWRF